MIKPVGPLFFFLLTWCSSEQICSCHGYPPTRWRFHNTQFLSESRGNYSGSRLVRGSVNRGARTVQNPLPYISVHLPAALLPSCDLGIRHGETASRTRNRSCWRVSVLVLWLPLSSVPGSPKFSLAHPKISCSRFSTEVDTESRPISFWKATKES